MAKQSKRQKAMTEIDRDRFYPVDEAISVVKNNATAKFDETIEVALNLGVDPRHADQMVRGVVSLPKGTGKDVRVAVFAKGAKADEAKAVGLINHLVPAGQAREKAAQIAATIDRNGPIAIRQAKKAIAYGAETDLDTAMILAIEAYNATVVTEDRLEGVRAFNAKRKPEFKGK